MLIIIVGIFSENSFVIGSIKVPATSNIIAPSKDKYADMAIFRPIGGDFLGKSEL